MSELQWWAQKGVREALLKEEWEARPKELWEVELEEWMDARDEEPYDQFNREEECE